MGGVFICYRRGDTAGFAGRIYDRLSKRFGRDKVFFDVRDIELGLDFVEVLSERVAKCDALVAVIGRDWTSSDNQRRLADRHDFVRIEIAAALDRNVRVIPVFVDDAAMPKRGELPRALQEFSRRQGIVLSHTNFDSDIRRLISDLSSLAKENRRREESDPAIAHAARRADEAKRARKAHGTVGAVRQGVKMVNLALQSGGALGTCNDAYTWGVLDAFAEDARVEISAISGAGAGAMNGAVFAYAMNEGGRERARQRLEQFWRRVSDKGALSLDVLNAIIDFDRLRATKVPKLFVAATNLRSGLGRIFRGDFDVLSAYHLIASACVPPSSPAVEIDGEAYCGGGYIGNPPLWPLFYETDCDDVVVVQINPLERIETPHTSEDISDRLTEITFNAGLRAEVRSAALVARLVKAGLLKSEDYRLSRLHRIGPPVDLGPTKNDVSWPLLNHARELGRVDAKTWLEENFDAIGIESTLEGLRVKREHTKQKRAPAS
jgi:NTE family protein